MLLHLLSSQTHTEPLLFHSSARKSALAFPYKVCVLTVPSSSMLYPTIMIVVNLTVTARTGIMSYLVDYLPNPCIHVVPMKRLAL